MPASNPKSVSNDNADRESLQRLAGEQAVKSADAIERRLVEVKQALDRIAKILEAARKDVHVVRGVM